MLNWAQRGLLASYRCLRPWVDACPSSGRGICTSAASSGRDVAETLNSSSAAHRGGLTSALHPAAVVLPMPKLSHAMTSGRIAKWHVREGDPVAMYDVLLTVETESLVEEAYRLDQFAGKIALLVESQEEGHVAALLGAEGEQVPVGRPIALLCELAEEAEAVRRAAGSRLELQRAVGDVYEARPGPPLRLLDWQSYLAQGPKSTGCL